MNHASLFSGIGGFDLAAEWVGWTNIFNCEIDQFPRRVLKYHFPNAIQYEDIKQTDFTIHRGDIDVLTGGFPCQPYSQAGKRLGKNDERHLWPHMLRAIQEIKPTWVVGENVRGLISWNNGLVFDEVQTDLEAEGYEVQSFILPAAGINAPHKRDRVWIVAHSNSNRKPSIANNDKQRQGELGGNAEDTNSSRLLHRESIQEGAEVRQQWDTGSGGGDRIHREEGSDASDTNSSGSVRRNRQGREGEEWEVLSSEQERREMGSEASGHSSVRTDINSDIQRWEERHISTESKEQELIGRSDNEKHRDWQEFPTQSPICGRDDGISTELDSITFPKWRRETIKAYGNAIVPQIACRIFQSINSSKA